MADIDACKADRSDAWAKIFDAIHEYQLMFMVDQDGGNFPLLDLMTGPGREISYGEDEMIALADEIHAALFPSPLQSTNDKD